MLTDFGRSGRCRRNGTTTWSMEQEFMASWVCCLDESISKWLDKYTCLGHLIVPRKPWPSGNEYHTICCSLSGVLFALEIVEGKDKPTERPAKEHSELGKTVSLCLRLTKSLNATGSLVILDSGFCVVKAILEMKRNGVFSAYKGQTQSWKKVTVNSPTFLSQSPKIATLPLLTLFKLRIANSNFSNFFIIWKH